MVDRELSELEIGDAALRMGLVVSKATKVSKDARRCKKCRTPLAKLNRDRYCFTCQSAAQDKVRERDAKTPFTAASIYGKKTLRKRVHNEAIALLDSKRKRIRRSSKL